MLCTLKQHSVIFCGKPEVGGDVISGSMAMEEVGLEVRVEVGSSRSNRFSDIVSYDDERRIVKKVLARSV